MSEKRYLFTSESVTEGHPDKVADQISDAVLDAIYHKDSQARVAAETLVTTGLVLVAGEITTQCYVDIPHVVRETVRSIGYTRAKYGFDCDTCAVLTSIDEQSADIALGVDTALEVKTGKTDREEEFSLTGAGDQGMVFGFACGDTPEYMPLPISLAHRLAQRLAEVRKKRLLPYLRPDGKSQVTVEYEGDRPVRVDTVILSAQHREDVSQEQLKHDLMEEVIHKVIPPTYMDARTKYYVNPTGRFVVGGPQGDTGLTGRKIIVDTYGGFSRHGGGAFSGKDPTKVDRSGAYAARYAAKNIVAAGLASKCELQVAYAIGIANPISISVDTYCTGKIPEERIGELVRKHFDLRPAAIIHHLDLRRPIYRRLGAYGHMGRVDLDVSWEKLDKVQALRQDAGL